MHARDRAVFRVEVRARVQLSFRATVRTKVPWSMWKAVLTHPSALITHANHFANNWLNYTLLVRGRVGPRLQLRSTFELGEGRVILRIA